MIGWNIFKAPHIFQEPEASHFQPAPPILPPPLPDSGLLSPDPLAPTYLPDLIPIGHRDSRSPVPSQLPRPTDPHQGRQQLVVEMGHEGAMIRSDDQFMSILQQQQKIRHILSFFPFFI